MNKKDRIKDVIVCSVVYLITFLFWVFLFYFSLGFDFNEFKCVLPLVFLCCLLIGGVGLAVYKLISHYIKGN